MEKHVLICDTTLAARDGTQGEQISFSAEGSPRITKKLAEPGVQHTVGGWPGSNPRDMRLFQLAHKARVFTTTDKNGGE